jgi:pimeloyl-ACP methyl ester carboxylesterase
MLARLHMPVRLVRGEADPVTAPVHVEAFAKMHGEESVVTVESAGHFVQAEQPEGYTRIVFDFVSENSSVGSGPTF